MLMFLRGTSEQTFATVFINLFAKNKLCGHLLGGRGPDILFSQKLYYPCALQLSSRKKIWFTLPVENPPNLSGSWAFKELSRDLQGDVTDYNLWSFQLECVPDQDLSGVSPAVSSPEPAGAKITPGNRNWERVTMSLALSGALAPSIISALLCDPTQD